MLCKILYKDLKSLSILVYFSAEVSFFGGKMERSTIPAEGETRRPPLRPGKAGAPPWESRSNLLTWGNLILSKPPSDAARLWDAKT